MADSIKPDNLDMALDDIIKVRNKQDRKKRGANRTALKTASRSRPTTTRKTNNRAPAHAAINKARGITTSTAPRVNKRKTALATKAKLITRRALQRTQNRLQPQRQARNRPTTTNRAPTKASGLRITVTNRTTTQGARNNTNNLGRNPTNRGTARPSILSRLGKRTLLDTRRRLPVRRALPLQNQQARQQARLTAARRTNQNRTANVVAQRRGMQLNTGRRGMQSTNNNGRKSPTLNDRFSQPRGTGARRVVSYNNQRNNNQRNNQHNNQHNNRSNQHNTRSNQHNTRSNQRGNQRNNNYRRW